MWPLIINKLIVYIHYIGPYIALGNITSPKLRYEDNRILRIYFREMKHLEFDRVSKKILIRAIQLLTSKYNEVEREWEQSFE